MTTPARFRRSPTRAPLDALVPVIDKALDYPRPAWTLDGKRLPDGVGMTEHYALPVCDATGKRWALRVPELDPDKLPAELTAKLTPAERVEFTDALRAREELPTDWAELEVEPAPVEIDREPHR